MKTLLLSVSAAVALTFVARADEPVGRFVIVAGSIMVDGQEQKTMMRIDTVTGETWQYVYLPVFTNKDGSKIVADGWSKLDENASAKWREQRKLIMEASKTPPAKQP